VPVEYAPRPSKRRPPPTYDEEGGEEDEGVGPPPSREPERAESAPIPRRSHAAAFVALALLLLGVYLASWTVIAPGLLALLLLSSGVTFLGSRLNPLSIGFYLTTKPSWTAIATVFLVAFLLFGVAYSYWRHGWGPILPRHLLPWS
jgi:hypothetical protein